MNYLSKGKFLISGEYLVLKGATGLAVPLKHTQNLQIEKHDEECVKWETFVCDKLWFSMTFRCADMEILDYTNHETAKRIIKLITGALKISSKKIDLTSLHLRSYLDFDINWGMGSSSSLISNIAYWFDIDPFELHKKTSDGSGYDIACARSETPILYSVNKDIRTIENIRFFPAFSKNLYFVYLGKKQDSDNSIAIFNSRKKKFTTEVRLISELSRHLANASGLTDFEYYLREHETIISSVLKQKRIKDTLFMDFPGEIKSMGAWGGDFVLVTWEDSQNALQNYMKDKGLTTIFKFDELMYKR